MIDIQKWMENLVFMHLIREGFPTQVGKTDQLESILYKDCKSGFIYKYASGLTVKTREEEKLQVYKR